MDDTGNIYICDLLNYRLRKIGTSGIITTIAGTGVAGYAPDGAKADTAFIEGVADILVDGMGNIFFKDKYRIRKIASNTGVLSTLAGNGIDAYSGDGGPATAAAISTTFFTIDSVGNFYLSEGSTSRIRMINTEGKITTIAGNGMGGVDPEGVSLIAARLNSPHGIAFSPAGELYFADKSGCKIRKITNDWMSVTNTLQQADELQIFPNPARGIVEVRTVGITGKAMLSITDVRGAVVAEQKITGSGDTKINVAHCPPGIYNVRVNTSTKTITKELLIK